MFGVVRNDFEEIVEDRWLSAMIDEAEKDKGEITRAKMVKKFAKDGIAF